MKKADLKLQIDKNGILLDEYRLEVEKHKADIILMVALKSEVEMKCQTLETKFEKLKTKAVEARQTIKALTTVINRRL